MSEVMSCYDLVKCYKYNNGIAEGYVLGIVLILLTLLIIKIIDIIIKLWIDDEKYD